MPDPREEPVALAPKGIVFADLTEYLKQLKYCLRGKGSTRNAVYTNFTVNAYN
jgi:hypothetical protein